MIAAKSNSKSLFIIKYILVITDKGKKASDTFSLPGFSFECPTFVNVQTFGHRLNVKKSV
jgi:hypothetical protein